MISLEILDRAFDLPVDTDAFAYYDRAIIEGSTKGKSASRMAFRLATN
jgi:hypothetical protein